MGLKEKILKKTAKIGMIGLGYVGLPLAVEFGKAGFTVIGLDQDKNKLIKLSKRINYIPDVKTDELVRLLNSKKLLPTDDYSQIKSSDVIYICVPTPLDRNKQPDISYIIAVTNELTKILRKDQLIILGSTTFPGTTEEVVLPKLESTGLKVGKDFFLSFAPERVDPGNKDYTTRNTTKVVGGVTRKCTEISKLLISQIINKVLSVSSPKVAETEKLLENIFRSVNIALVNELTLLCNKMKINVWEVIEAAKTKPYGFMPFYPGPGIGGHCIPIDPYYLTWKAKEFNMQTRFIELAGEINDSMPDYVVKLTQDGLNDTGKSLNGAKVLILGAAYKKDINDVRESPSLHIIGILRSKKAKTTYNDPYISNIEVNGEKMRSQKLTKALLKSVDCVIIVTGHSVYDYDFIVKNAKLIIDTRNVTKNIPDRSKVILI
jgi:UDP-N-acetyl-D-glucosamine dehydrogenase